MLSASVFKNIHFTSFPLMNNLDLISNDITKATHPVNPVCATGCVWQIWQRQNRHHWDTVDVCFCMLLFICCISHSRWQKRYCWSRVLWLRCWWYFVCIYVESDAKVRQNCMAKRSSLQVNAPPFISCVKCVLSQYVCKSFKALTVNTVAVCR